MKHTLATLFAFAAAAALADPATYYVDERGNDAWDGTASYDDRDETVSPVKGPKQTLKAAATLVTATSSADEVGDTIYIYPGDYRNADSTPAYCASLPAGCRLVGVGDKLQIRIHGSGTSWDARETEATSSGRKRCLYLGNWTLVKGVTLRDGRHNSNGGCCSGGGFIVDCFITENYSGGSSGQGGALSKGAVPVRCLFLKNAAVGYGNVMNEGSAWNCVFDQTGVSGGYAIYKTSAYNCTFVGGSGSSYNGPLTNCICKVKVANTTKYGDDTIINSSLRLDSEYVPVYGNTGNPAINRGDTYAYELLFPDSNLVRDQKYLDFNGRTRIVNDRIDAGAAEYRPHHWYVATTGDDTNVGDAPNRAKQTLAGAMGIANLDDNDVVHVAEGVYDSGEMWDGTCSNRLYVTMAVGIVADGAKERTIIMGKVDDDAEESDLGCTIRSVRCVNLGNRYAYLKGFTITGGRAIAGAGGVYNSVDYRGALIDCIITNNAANNSTGLAPKAGGVDNTVCIGCYFDDNLLNGGGAGTGGSTGYDSSYINSRIAGGNIYASDVVLNCRLDNAAGTSDNAKATYRNCVVLKSKSYYEGKGILFDNCLFSDDVPGLAGMFDENLAPKYGTVPVDYSAGETDATTTYNDRFPGTWARFKSVGYGGGQRIYNGKIDIGPVECDWRGEFAKNLAGRHLSVTQASENVTTNAIAGVTLFDGDSISIEWPVASAGDYSFNLVVDGAGEASATIDGEAVVPVAGVCSFAAEAADVGMVKRISVAFAGEGSATISSFTSPNLGMILFVR